MQPGRQQEPMYRPSRAQPIAEETNDAGKERGENVVLILTRLGDACSDRGNVVSRVWGEMYRTRCQMAQGVCSVPADENAVYMFAVS